MTLPIIYLIRRDAVDSDAVKDVVRITPLSAALAASPADAEAARKITDQEILGARGAPLAIVANFEHPVVAVHDDGSVEILCPAPSQSNP
jgi:hypothetical protein